MTEILLIRHAETDLKGTFCGQIDPPLNEAGRAQRADLLSRLRGLPLSLVISSDLRRAQETALPIAEQAAAPCQLRPNLREIHFGEWEGLTWQQIEERDPAFAKKWLAQFPRLPAPGGESFISFQLRIHNELDHVRVLAPTGLLAVVTHGGVIRELLRTTGLPDEDVWRTELAYASITPYRVAMPPFQMPRHA